VVAKFREILSLNKQAASNFEGKRFNIRKVNELEFRKQYQIDIRNRFAALENLSVDENINRNWENIENKVKTSAKIL
jgi:hypothetical protein